MTDPLGQSQVLPYLKGLSALGHQFHLISFEKKERYQDEYQKIEKLCSEAGIQWHPLSYTKKPPLLSTVYDVRRMSALAKKLHQKNQFDIVHCRSYIAALIGLKMKNRYQTKFVFDMRGFWADERLEGGIWNIKNPVFKVVYNFFKKKEIDFFKQSDHIISLTAAGKKEIRKLHPSIAETKITVIPCCVDLEKFQAENYTQEEINNLKNNLNILPKEKVLGYVGSIGTWYMLNEMLDYFVVFKETYPESKFLFITPEHPDGIISKASEKGIPSASIIVKRSAHNEVPAYMLTFDYSIFFIKPTFSKSASSPTKQAELMAMGIPIICNSGVGDTDSIVMENGAGMVLHSLSKEAYKKQLNATFVFNQTQSVAAAQKDFSLKEGVTRYQKVYETILNNI
jgi:glycosyltransferase involved in cell wall biosynthesis